MQAIAVHKPEQSATEKALENGVGAQGPGSSCEIENDESNEVATYMADGQRAEETIKRLKRKREDFFVEQEVGNVELVIVEKEGEGFVYSKGNLYKCNRCGYGLTNTRHCARHSASCHRDMFDKVCNKKFGSKGVLKQHYKKEHPRVKDTCYL